ncbi:response regulator transcription factor [Mangrovivirga cuniculi]|uniref:Phosphate regulon transcriptional regulatory protein PhoB n=1 Tax=Mangrovivirga cuniculi TaxID=2715131 RepID=A0A4D7JFM9_9BACT|nr:response regulator transcription factor [Mangrovivirga cuniculi]QCK13487.1 DNA-binding response regulator [Mangrovivirga cuniculi]
MPAVTDKKILIVDDEPDVVELLSYNFNSAGYQVQEATNGKEAIDIAKNFNPDLIILDIMMPDIDGVETCRQIRNIPKFKETFVFFLTARSEEYSEVAAFDVGGDDYIIKPIKPRALLKKVESLFKRETKTVDDRTKIETKDFMIDKASYTVRVGEEVIQLAKKEFDLLYFLASNSNNIFGRDILLHHVWGADVFVAERTVDVHIRKIREKLGDRFIKTIKGVGYKFDY